MNFMHSPIHEIMWDWSGNLEQLVVKKKGRTKRRGKPAKLNDEKSRKNSRDERRRREIRRIWWKEKTNIKRRRLISFIKPIYNTKTHFN